MEARFQPGLAPLRVSVRVCAVGNLSFLGESREDLPCFSDRTGSGLASLTRSRGRQGLLDGREA